MKKFLLSFLGAAAFFCSEAQLYLNELYVRPNVTKGNHEYFELYNAGVAPENADCYTLVTYFNYGKTGGGGNGNNGANQAERGFFVVDIPSLSVAPQGYLVGSSVTPTFRYQNGPATSDFSWNDGNINRYVYRNGVLVLDNTGAPYYNIFYNKAKGLGESELYSAFLFKNSELVDAFLGHHKGIEVPSEITELGRLTNAGMGCSAGFSYDFRTINAEPDQKFGYVIPAAGVDNGYYRCGDGPCPENAGAWQKASAPSEHTPGRPNSSKQCKGDKGNHDDEDDSDGEHDGDDNEAEGNPTVSTTPDPSLFTGTTSTCTLTSGCFEYKFTGATVNNTNGTATLNFSVKTNCDNALSYVAFQLPNGAKATNPTSSLNSNVENPTNNPFYSIKFNTSGESKNGDVSTFSYTVKLTELATMTSLKVQAHAGRYLSSVTFDAQSCGTSGGGGGDDGDDDDGDGGDGDDDDGDSDGDDDDSDGDDDDSDGDDDDSDGDDDDSDGDDDDSDGDDDDSDGDDDDSDGDDDDGDGDGNGSEYEVEYACSANTFNFSISGGSYPVTVRLYADDGDGVLESTDPLRGTVVMTEPGTGTIMKQPNDEVLILTLDGPGICDDAIEIIAECPADIILPVTFKTFAASRKDQTVGLSWQTATEINNKGFYVERLIGNGAWENAGFVASKAFEGNSSSELSYTFTDVNPSRSMTIYRLRQVDIDGRIKYSESRQVRGNGENARTMVYPNPTSNGSVNIVFEEANISRNVFVTDMNGRVIQQWRNYTNNSVRVDNLQPGMYMVRITDLQSGVQVSEKILVNKR